MHIHIANSAGRYLFQLDLEQETHYCGYTNDWQSLHFLRNATLRADVPNARITQDVYIW
jgi:hypothetical protein